MKILFVTDGIHPWVVGGMQKHSAILSSLLAESGHDIWLVHPGGKGYSKNSFEDLFSVREGVIHEVYIPWPKVGKLPGHYIRENFKYSKKVFQYFKDSTLIFDIIYVQGFTGKELLNRKKIGGTVPPVLVNFHGFEMFQPAASIKVRLEQTMLKKAVIRDVFLADGVYSFGGKIDTVLEDLGLSSDKILDQTNGIQEEWLVSKDDVKTSSGRRSFVFIGRNERRKGIEELNEAIKQLINEKVNFYFQFIGPIPRDAQINHESIKYHGEIRDKSNIQEVLRNSDCLVCPSHAEGMPTVILEAMASGCAVLATDVGAVARMMDNNGILLDKSTKESVYKGLIELINTSDQHLNQLKINSLEIVNRDFLWAIIAKRKIKQFEEMITKNSNANA